MSTPSRFYATQSDRFIADFTESSTRVFTEQLLSQNQRKERDLARRLTTPTKSSPFPLALAELPSPPNVRHVNYTPFRVLDAPAVRDDFYTSLLDCTKNGQILVALDNILYIWKTGAAEHIFNCQNGFITTCAFSNDANLITTTTSKGETILIDRISKTILHREMNSAATLKWTSNTCFSTGDFQGTINSYDIRILSKTTSTFSIVDSCNSHLDRIVGMTSKSETHQLATGCNGHVYNHLDFRL